LVGSVSCPDGGMSDSNHAILLTLPEALTWAKSREPPTALRVLLAMLHQLCRSGRVRALGRPSRGPSDASVPIPASEWVDLWFDSDGEKLRCTDLFLGILPRRRAWTSVQFSQVDLAREWPRVDDAADAVERARMCWWARERQTQNVRERSRQEWIDNFVDKQRRIRRWISFEEIADVCARTAAPASTTEEDDVRSLAYRRLLVSFSRGEFERDGKSQVLMLMPNRYVSIPPHRLTSEYLQGMMNAYGASDFTSDSGLVSDHLRFCWLPCTFCKEWFERHFLEWPNALNPQADTVPIPPERRETQTELEILQPPAPSGRTHQKGQRGRRPGSGSIDDRQALRDMLRLLASGEAPSVNAAADQVAPSRIVKRTGTEASAAARLRRKFANQFGTCPHSGKTWRDIADELQPK
jgi:hypothetical protein